ncbi:ABC transporter permease [Nodularia sphaerocarpa]|uniref:ABC transporter permease n=1 Tax=Nodularia sphaerocarpa TaxID=137816 RepID=UPI001EFAF892|nr:ABC transporter permease [Nodularia sphaerocarpa]MDB9373392.1 ABC transporter permease [Nodularia sphaerocarpa CS-585]MDB9379389.1 ABC transporter permease [Nodularia sphaerocarpa CS-585A2]ULP71385.1 Macrolide export ATP-binding/permease protein MacB [Nodularia sphaerocarpa UHCC 0038]
MNINDLLSLTFHSLRSNPLRSFLSSLGVFMGVFAVSGTLQVSDIGRIYLKTQLQNMESPQISIDSAYDPITYQEKQYLNEDVALLKRKLSGWKYIAPVQNFYSEPIFVGNQKIDAESQAVTPEFLAISGRKLIAGKFFTVNDLQYTRSVAVIDQLLAQKLFKSKNPLGKMIYFQKKSYYIQGVIETRNSNSWSQNQGLILIPLSVYQSLKSSPFFDKITITPQDTHNIEELQKQAVSILEKRFPNVAGIYASSNIEFVKAQEDQLNTVTIILLIIGGISLFVGGVGIANITIASVVERTSEIGLRRAIGATQVNILIQFLLEATIISMTGGILAISAVQGITIVTLNILTLPYQFNYQTPLISLSSAILVGVTSSFLPAVRASKLDPVEALRSQ